MGETHTQNLKNDALAFTKPTHTHTGGGEKTTFDVPFVGNTTRYEAGNASRSRGRIAPPAGIPPLACPLLRSVAARSGGGGRGGHCQREREGKKIVEGLAGLRSFGRGRREKGERKGWRMEMREGKEKEETERRNEQKQSVPDNPLQTKINNALGQGHLGVNQRSQDDLPLVHPPQLHLAPEIRDGHPLEHPAVRFGGEVKLRVRGGGGAVAADEDHVLLGVVAGVATQ